jgi:hypothetical protein
MRVAAILCCFFVAGCASSAGSASSDSRAITIADCAGNSVVVPTQGMRRSEEGIAVARDLQQLQKIIVERTAHERPSNVEAERGAVLCQLLDASVADLKQAYKIASMTSGPLPTKLVSSAASLGRSASAVLGAGTPPDTNRVTTFVTSSVPPPYDLFYLPFLKYRNKVWDWSSHTPGEKLDIGAYYFRVRAGGKEFDELVVVFDEPTKRVIHGQP